MSATKHSQTGKAKHAELAAQLRAAAELLEKATANREVLAELSQEERTRLLKAAGDLYCPDVRGAAALGQRNFTAPQESKGAARSNRVK